MFRQRMQYMNTANFGMKSLMWFSFYSTAHDILRYLSTHVVSVINDKLDSILEWVEDCLDRKPHEVIVNSSFTEDHSCDIGYNIVDFVGVV